MITILKLSEKFETRDIFPYGPILVIPKEKFLLAWKTDLGIQGHRCIETFIGNNQQVVFVKKEIESNVKIEFSGDAMEKASKDKTAISTRIKRPYRKRQNKTTTRLYTLKMEKRIAELYNAGTTYPQMAKTMNNEFPKKTFTEKNLALKVYAMRKDIRQGKLKGVTLKPRLKGRHTTAVQQIPHTDKPAPLISKVSLTCETSDGYVASVSGSNIAGCCQLLRALIEAAENV